MKRLHLRALNQGLFFVMLCSASSAFAFPHYYFPYISAYGYPGAWGFVPWIHAPFGYWHYPN